MEPTAKQQLSDTIKNATNVLVTSTNDPTIDELAGVIGLTLMLRKLGKHSTAVVSGDIPKTLDFLNASGVMEKDVSSMRDFVISLSKEKADKLRYKVEDNAVKIFITPYKTTLDEKDFKFGQGDFNVDVVVALGVSKRDELDRAVYEHSGILHEAKVLTVNNDKGAGFGTIDWQETSASSVSEMLVSISEALGAGLVDGQVATALLTGIISATERFSNNRTSPKVMTMAAQLMAAGADQQKIVSNLGEVAKPSPKEKEIELPKEITKQLNELPSEKQAKLPEFKPPAAPPAVRPVATTPPAIPLPPTPPVVTPPSPAPQPPEPPVTPSPRPTEPEAHINLHPPIPTLAPSPQAKTTVSAAPDQRNQEVEAARAAVAAAVQNHPAPTDVTQMISHTQDVPQLPVTPQLPPIPPVPPAL